MNSLLIFWLVYTFYLPIDSFSKPVVMIVINIGMNIGLVLSMNVVIKIVF